MEQKEFFTFIDHKYWSLLSLLWSVCYRECDLQVQARVG